jgi:hypothetical protein
LLDAVIFSPEDGDSMFLQVKVVVEQLALLLRILEAPRSDLCPETGYPD